MVLFRVTWKFVGFVLYVILYLGWSALGRLVVRDLDARKRFHAWTVHRVSHLALRLLSIRVTFKDPPAENRNFLFVGNHLGFLDVLLIASLRPMLFVTSVEMRETPFLGLLCEMGGCLFVERRSRSRLLSEINEIGVLLSRGFSIAIYPEGTSGDGSRVLPFKKSLLVAAGQAGVPIKPMVVNYRSINGEPMSHKWRDYVCWYGDLTFLPALWRLFTLRKIEAEISFFDEVAVAEGQAPREFTERLRAVIEANYVAIPFPEEKGTGAAINRTPEHV